jgi:hypothetical protein
MVGEPIVGNHDRSTDFLESVTQLARALQAIVFASTVRQSLIDKCEEDYRSALSAMNHDVDRLIRGGREMAGVMMFSQNLTKIAEVHSVLSAMYSFLFMSQDVLSHYGSKRLRRIRHELKKTSAMILDEIHDPVGDPGILKQAVEAAVLSELHALGFHRKHWYIKPVALAEIEYMIATLKILIEPDYVPFGSTDKSEDEERESDRYVPVAVKISVWRRDEGKCVECGSKEKLEYDHIIPISRGGSNTERNVQLLCEKCNRKKFTRIQ